MLGTRYRRVPVRVKGDRLKHIREIDELDACVGETQKAVEARVGSN